MQEEKKRRIFLAFCEYRTHREKKEGIFCMFYSKIIISTLYLLLFLILDIAVCDILNVSGQCVSVYIGSHKYKLLQDTSASDVVIYGMDKMQLISSSNSYDSLRGMDSIILKNSQIPVRIDFGYQETPLLNPGTCDGIFPLGEMSPIWNISETISISGSSVVTGRSPPRGSIKVSPGGIIINDYPNHVLNVEFAPHRTQIVIPSNMISISGHLNAVFPVELEIPLEYYMLEGILSMSRDREQINDNSGIYSFSHDNETISLGLYIGQISVTSYSKDGSIHIMPLQCLNSGQNFYGAILVTLLLTSVFLYYWQMQSIEFCSNFVNLWFYSATTKKQQQQQQIPLKSSTIKQNGNASSVSRYGSGRSVHRIVGLSQTPSRRNLTDTSDEEMASSSSIHEIEPSKIITNPDNRINNSSVVLNPPKVLEFRVGFPRNWTSGHGIRCIMTKYEIVWIFSCQIFLYTFFLAFDLSQPASCRFCQITWACTSSTDGSQTSWENARIVMQNSVFPYGTALMAFNLFVICFMAIFNHYRHQKIGVNFIKTELRIAVIDFLAFFCWVISVPFEYSTYGVVLWTIFSFVWFWVTLWGFLECCYFPWGQNKISLNINIFVSLVNALYSMTCIIILSFSSVLEIGFGELASSTDVMWMVLFTVLLCPSVPIYIAIKIASGTHLIQNNNDGVICDPKTRTDDCIINTPHNETICENITKDTNNNSDNKKNFLKEYDPSIDDDSSPPSYKQSQQQENVDSVISLMGYEPQNQQHQQQLQQHHRHHHHHHNTKKKRSNVGGIFPSSSVTNTRDFTALNVTSLGSSYNTFDGK